MAGAHTRSARPGSGRQPAGVGWWQPPKPRRPTPGVEEAGPRHRSADPSSTTGLLDPARLRRGIRFTMVGAVGAAVVAPLAAFTLGYLLFPLPAPDAAARQQVALVAFADGSELGRLVPAENNPATVPIEQVPAHLRAAVLAAEDRTFYSNPGFDVGGLLRAAWNQLRGEPGGGSTITQQYVRQTLVGDQRTPWRTFRELVLAVKISQERSKEEILADYLNASYFGRGSYGVQAASRAYFGKNVSELGPAEGALLAGMIQSPSRSDPAINPDRAVQRWNVVLDGMVAEGWLDRTARHAVQFPLTVPRRPPSAGLPADDRGHIIAAINDELSRLGISEQDLSRGGLRITSTVDPRRQQQAVDAAIGTLTDQPKNLRSAMVAIDPATGAVVAYYGGDNGHGLDYTRAQRLAGSTFKPFVVLAGLLRTPPVRLSETFDGEPISGVRNAEGADCRRCDLRQAMTVSNNVVFATLARQVGPDAVAAAARAAGISTPLEDPNPGIALGNKEVSAFDLASAYATLAAGGVWRPPHLVKSVVDADGRLLYQATTRGEQRFPEPVARNVTETMLKVAERDGLALPGGRPVAAKTGTVESRLAGQNNDAWMAGFTPELATSVWMGTDRNAPIRTRAGTPISGSGLPGDAWREFMTDALASEPVQQFSPFEPIGEIPAGDQPDPSTTPSGPPSSTDPTVPPGTGPSLAPAPPTRSTAPQPTRPRPTRTTEPSTSPAEPTETGEPTEPTGSTDPQTGEPTPDPTETEDSDLRD